MSGTNAENPYAAPLADLAAPPLDAPADLSEAETIRRTYLTHEASVQSVGSLYYLGAVFGALAGIGVLVAATRTTGAANNPAGPVPGGLYLGLGAFYLVMASANFALGWGLQKLQTWARWTVAVLTLLSLLYVLGVGAYLSFIQPMAGGFVLLIGGGITGYILYLMVSSRAGMVFSPQYQTVIDLTPHIRYRTSLRLKIALVAILLIIIIAIVATILRAS